MSDPSDSAPPAAAPPTLRIELGSRRAHVRLKGRVSIGSDRGNRVIVKSQGVLREHACIYPEGNQWFVENLSSEAATQLNGTAIQQKQNLQHGDLIQIGKARMKFQQGKAPRPATQPNDRLMPEVVAGEAVAAGGEADEVLDAEVVESIALSDSTVCGVCQCEIEVAEPIVCCDKCGLPYHDECWYENHGCAAYGCENVRVLKTGPDIALGSTLPPVLPPQPTRRRQQEEEEEDEIPWEYALLAGSALAVLLGAVMCGFPAILTAVGCGMYMARHPGDPVRRAVLMVGLIGSIFGVLFGMVVTLSLLS